MPVVLYPNQIIGYIIVEFIVKLYSNIQPNIISVKDIYLDNKQKARQLEVWREREDEGGREREMQTAACQRARLSTLVSYLSVPQERTEVATFFFLIN